MNKILQLLLVATLTILFISSGYAQLLIKGSVKNNSGQPVGDVQIRLKGDLEVTAKTDNTGNFSVKIPENSSKILIFTKEGFDKREIKVSEDNPVEIILQSSVKYNQYGKKVERTPLNVESRNGILVFESVDGSYKYWFDSRVYFDGFFGLGEPLNPVGNGVNIRRARFALKTNLAKYWNGEIDLDFAYSQLELKDAYLKYQRNNWFLKLGNYKESFSMETTTTSRYVTFIERSLVSKFSPSRHLGVQGSAWGKHWLAIGGIHFQDIGDAEAVGFSQDANKDNGTDEGMSYTGRFVYRPIQKPGMVVHLGASASYRTPKTHAEVPNSYRMSTRSLTSINRKKYLDTDDIMNVDNRQLFGLELAGSYNQFMFQAEYMINKVNRSDDSPDAQFEGGFVQAGCLLFGGKYVYNHIEGEFTQVDRGKPWGDVELAFRYDYIDINDMDAKIYGGAANAYTFGVNYHINDNVKMMLNYSYLDHDRFANGKGKLNIYKDGDGNLYKDAFDIDIPTGEGGDDFGFISLRVEVDF